MALNDLHLYTLLYLVLTAIFLWLWRHFPQLLLRVKLESLVFTLKIPFILCLFLRGSLRREGI